MTTATGVPTATEHPSYLAFAGVVERVIAPAAVEVDAGAVPASHLAALGATGYWGWTTPVEYGGSPVPAEVHRAAEELLFGACPSTALIASQHFGPIQHALRVGTPALLGLLPRLASGELIGAGAFGHVRSWPGRASVTATRVGDGYVFDGVIPFLSGWGLVGLPWTGAIDADNRQVVFALVDLPQPGVTAEPLQLAAVQGSRTVAARLDRVHVPAERVVLSQDVDEWKALDGADGTQGNAQASLPGPIGVARAAIHDALRLRPGEPSLLALAEEIETVRGTLPPGPAARAELCSLAVRATNAALVARGGAGLGLGDIAQVRARAALFLQVRGLAPRVRVAQLARWAG